MNVSEIQKKREKLLGEAGDRQRIAEGMNISEYCILCRERVK